MPHFFLNNLLLLAIFFYVFNAKQRAYFGFFSWYVYFFLSSQDFMSHSFILVLCIFFLCFVIFFYAVCSFCFINILLAYIYLKITRNKNKKYCEEIYKILKQQTERGKSRWNNWEETKEEERAWNPKYIYIYMYNIYNEQKERKKEEAMIIIVTDLRQQ